MHLSIIVQAVSQALTKSCAREKNTVIGKTVLSLTFSASECTGNNWIAKDPLQVGGRLSLLRHIYLWNASKVKWQ